MINKPNKNKNNVKNNKIFNFNGLINCKNNLWCIFYKNITDGFKFNKVKINTKMAKLLKSIHL
jgi:hypothetical protein